jgi:predicted GIY-YIG superfamily endonuclease
LTDEATGNEIGSPSPTRGFVWLGRVILFVMENPSFVYILRSVNHADKIYVGMTNDLQRRLEEHNAESQIYSRRYAPWKLIGYVALPDRLHAARFEKYLKSPSGKAFAHKHLMQPDQISTSKAT